MNKLIVFACLVCCSAFLQAQEEPVIVTGSELIGRVENGMSVREVNGNVALRQGNVVITCARAIQYLADNNARLIGNVVVTQDTLTIRTPEALYYGNEKRAYSDKGVTLSDRSMTLTARTGEYFFKIQKADFRENVVLRDTATTLYSERLVYFRRETKAVAEVNVKIVDKENTIFADSLVHVRNEQSTFGFRNVLISNRMDAVSIYGDRVTDFRKRMYSVVDENPLLVKTDTIYDSVSAKIKRIDTLVISALKMEAYRDTGRKFIATDSVKIIRGDFVSKNDYSVFYDSDEKLLTYKLSEAYGQPIMWYGPSQLTGDTIKIFLRKKKIDRAEIFGSALIVSQNTRFRDRFDQVVGGTVKMFFDDNRLQRTDVFGSVLSVYYTYDDDEPNGLVKGSSRNASIVFLDNKVDEVHLYGEPKSEYHPENVIAGKERQILLPQFKLFTDKPVKEKIFTHYRNRRFVFIP